MAPVAPTPLLLVHMLHFQWKANQIISLQPHNVAECCLLVTMRKKCAPAGQSITHYQLGSQIRHPCTSPGRCTVLKMQV
eukprot:1157054-Pelagomonas_calceolata.AAC.10